MATANFHARLERIEQAQASAPYVKPKNFRAPGAASVRKVRSRRSRRHPIMEHLVAISFGIVLGCLAAVAVMGLSIEASPWGPGSDWNALAYYPIMGSLALAPILLVVSVFLAARRPGFALFSLGYVTGIVVTLLV